MPALVQPPSKLARAIASVPPKRTGPLWKGPCADGPLGGVTQSMLQKFLVCRERFRARYVVGLEPLDQWDKRTGYGDMWHVCEEALAGEGCLSSAGRSWHDALDEHVTNLLRINQGPRREDIVKWANVCRVQFPVYVEYWSKHPDVVNRVPMVQEEPFDVRYLLPSGRSVRLRGKFDSVDRIGDALWLQENKTRGDIDEESVRRQLGFDLQTNVYLIALESWLRDRHSEDDSDRGDWLRKTIRGVRYNVVRRPLSGGRGMIVKHKAKATKERRHKKTGAVLEPSRVTPAETDAEFYERLRRDYIAADPSYWFFRVRSEVSAADLAAFRRQCLDPVLEQLCWWYDEVVGVDTAETAAVYGYPPSSFRYPYGVYNDLDDSSSSPYDAYLETGSEVGLRRVDTLFKELN